MKKIITILICALIICSAFPVSPLAAQTPTVSVSSAAAKQNDIVTLDIILSDNAGFCNLGLQLDYNSDALELTNITPNENVGAIYTGAETVNTKPYVLTWNSAENVTFNGTLATVSFKVLTDAVGEYPVSVSYYKGRNGDYTDGTEVNYDEDFASLNLAYSNGKIQVVPTVNVTVNDQTVTLVSYEYTATPSGTVIIVAYNADGDLEMLASRTPNEPIDLDFSNIQTDWYVKAMWWNEDMKPLCDFKQMNF